MKANDKRRNLPFLPLFGASVLILAASFFFFISATSNRALPLRWLSARDPLLAEASTRAAGDDTLRRTPIVEAIEKTRPAVVNISTEYVVRESGARFGFHDEFFDDVFKDFYDMFPQRDFKRTSLGSGAIITKDGYIVTNEHVVMRGSKITVVLQDNREFEAKLVGADSNLDLAIIKIDVKNLPTAALGDSDSLLIGEPVIAIGNPFGLELTVTTGVVSALKRSFRVDQNRVYSDFVQTDASINPGNSGGPLINIYGEVIGINTAIIEQARGIGFAIPINRVKRAVKDLIAHGEVKKAWLGVRTQELTAELAEQFGFQHRRGVIVTDVIEEGPASKAGIRRGDIVSEINGAPVSSPDEFRERTSALMVGEKLVMKIFRDGKEKSLTAVAAEPPIKAAEDIAGWLLGVRVSEISNKLISKYGLRTKTGVVVTEVLRGGYAEKIGIKPGDVIRQIGPVETAAMKNFNEAIVMSVDRGSTLLVIQRGVYIYHTTFE